MPLVNLWIPCSFPAGETLFRFAPSAIIGARVAPSSGASHMEPPPSPSLPLGVLDTLLLGSRVIY